MFQTNFKGKDILVISDTHGYHRNLNIPKADIIIHCGDICTDGNMFQILDFFEWYDQLDIPCKLFLSGNHDFTLDFDWQQHIGDIPEGIIFMNDNRVLNIEGISIGALMPGFFFQMSFASICESIDILFTHEPPLGILDNGLGCPNLLDYVQTSKPKYHFFGHIHECAGRIIKNGTTFVNVCDYGI